MPRPQSILSKTLFTHLPSRQKQQQQRRTRTNRSQPDRRAEARILRHKPHQWHRKQAGKEALLRRPGKGAITSMDWSATGNLLAFASEAGDCGIIDISA